MVGKPKRSGRRVGSYGYEEDLFLSLIGIEPKNTSIILAEARNKIGNKLSWGTVQGVLERLKNDGKIKGKRVGAVNVWYR